MTGTAGARTGARALQAHALPLVVIMAALGFGVPASTPAHAEDAARLIRRAVERTEAGRAAVPADVRRFYELRHFRPAWSPRAAAAVTQAMEQAEAEGLIAADYPLEQPPPAGARAKAAWEIRLTGAFLRYAKDIRTGRIAPAKVYEEVDLPPASFDAPAALDAALDKGALGAFIAGLPPQRPEYAFLREALAYYRRLESRGDWSVPVRAGEPLSKLPAAARDKLSRRLAAEDPGQAGGKARSAAALRTALRGFQRHFGLAPTGSLTAKTVALLNQPFSDRVLQIEANMERWRWLPRVADKRYIEVNAPDASLKVVEDGRTILTSPVVVGRRDWATPILATAVQAVVVNPPWHVPPDMAGEEILPKLIGDASYLAAHNMVLLDGPPGDPHGRTIDWRGVPADPFPYHIQQLPGPRSGLGGLLLDMPNNFGVYLHDTPEKQLFERSNRLLSHGCVRVREIAAVASFALFGDTRQAGRIPHPPRRRTERIALDRPLPVYMVYWTAFRDADGAMAFRQDVYGRDVRLIAALYGKSSPRAERPAATAAEISASKLPAP